MRQAARIKAVLVGLLFAGSLLAQRDLGTITGTVTDPQGGAIPGAKITLIEDATGIKYAIETNTSGEFTRPALKPGVYTVEVEAKGFKKAVQKNAIVTEGDRLGVNIQLQVGETSTTVEVSAEAPLLQTESNIIGADIATKQVGDLPLGGQRTFSFLARLSPGVLTAENGARDATGGGFSANGVRSNGQNNFLLNGVDNNVNVIDFLNQTSFVIGPPIDAIGEMRVMTNGYNAEYGRGAGGVVNVSLKGGTNELHGSLFEYLQNTDLNANRWENNASGTPRGPFRQNQFGAAAGGPIIKNKLFIFGDYQGTRIASSGGAIQNLGFGGFYTIPTQAMTKGDYSALLGPSVGAAPDGTNVLQNGIYDPASTVYSSNGTPVSRTMFAGNVIPLARQDPVAQKIMALYPAPNQPVAPGSYPQNDFYVSTPGAQNTDQGDGRVDYHLSDKDSLFGTISWSNNNKTSAPPFPGALDGANFYGASEEDLGRNAQISYTRVWNAAIISETRIGYSRLVTARTQGNANTDEFKALGFGGYDPTTADNGGMPQFGMGRYSQIGANDWLPSKEYSDVWDFIQNVAITKGKHAYKFGAEFRPIQFPFFQVPYPHGEMNMSQNETAFPSTANGSNGKAFNTVTGDETASMLLGYVDWGQISTNNFISSTKKAYAFYAQDDWKLSSKLTLNIGLRYELFSPIGEKFGRQSNFDIDNLTLYIPSGPDQSAPLPSNFASSFPNVTVSRGQVDQYMIPWDKTDFGPRIGFAYNAFSKTVFRAGFGMFYGVEENQGGNPNRGESVPFNQSTVLQHAGPNGTVNIFDPNPYFTGGLAGGYPTDVFNLPAPIAFREVANDFRNSLVDKWNVAVQRELPWDMALEVSYVGNHQAHQLLQPDFNACPDLGTTNSNISCATLRPVPYIGGISGTASFGYGNYNGMTMKLEKRLTKGIEFMSAYTYGHAYANSGTTLSGSPGYGTPDPTNWASAYASAAWDIRNNWVTSFTYNVPFGKGQRWGTNMNAVASAALANWQMNGILTIHSGMPFTLDYNGCQGVWNLCRPDVVSGMNPNAAPSGGRTPAEWFNIASVVPAAALTGGNVPLQSNYGPGVHTLDFSLFKAFPISERFGFQFRAEATNLTNTPQYGFPDNNLQDANFGKVTSTNPGSERHVQFALRFQF
jgi:hypothetical protein